MRTRVNLKSSRLGKQRDSENKNNQRQNCRAGKVTVCVCKVHTRRRMTDRLFHPSRHQTEATERRKQKKSKIHRVLDWSAHVIKTRAHTRSSLKKKDGSIRYGRRGRRRRKRIKISGRGKRKESEPERDGKSFGTGTRGSGRTIMRSYLRSDAVSVE